MKFLRFAPVVAICLLLGACGNAPPAGSDNINGNWTVTLTDQNNSPVFDFTTSFVQSNGMGISVTNLHFNSASPCFASGETAVASFIFGGTFNGSVTGRFGLTIQSGTPGGNTLALQGTVRDHILAGSWTLTGITSGCTGSGTFIATRF
jgi:hypothetical protein